MRAIAVSPGHPDTAGLIDLPEPPESDGSILVRTRLIGVCGTDLEIAIDGYGTPPPGEDRLVLGHESLGEVIEAPADSGFTAGDLVVGVVRRPDPDSCLACAADEWDMCRNGGYVERGIKERHGYGSERVRLDPRYAIPVDPALGELGILVEPTSVVAKAWEQVERIGTRAWFDPRVALITGAGPIGLLAAMLARQRGFETYVTARRREGLKPKLVEAIGAQYYTGPLNELPVAPDVVIECTGAGRVAVDAVLRAAPSAIICLTGLAHGDAPIETRPGEMNNELVLGNKVAFGTVNAARRHYDQAAAALARADPEWLGQMITRRLPAAEWPSALQKQPDDIKVVIEMTAA
jgi:threonine dehydrogenase-like Zn-dependent dehydrogenase